MSYDPKCYDLAVDFLEEVTPTPPDRAFDKLAQHIHDAIKDFLNDAENFYPPEPMFDTGRDRDERKHEAAEQQRLK
jgi:hypothetical protein